VIDFAALPPEINSARMYAGPGPGSLLAAAAAWQAVADGLLASGTGMAITSGALVTGPWTGPSSALMGMSSTQFVAWVLLTAATAEKASAAAMGAVGAYDTAFAATIPPWEVERNQVTTATLIATNFLGVNSAAIAASEAQYQEYWAQDSSAMLDYAANNAAIAASLAAPPFTPAIPNTSLAGLAGQAAAAGQAAGTDAGQAAGTASQAGSAASSMGGNLGSLSSVMSAPAQAMGTIPQLLQGLTKPFSQVGEQLPQMMSMFPQMFTGLGTGMMTGAGTFGGSALGGSLTSMTSMPGGGSMGLGSMVTASMGRSGTMGALSAPLRFNTMQENWAESNLVSKTTPLRSFTPEGFVAQEDNQAAMAPGGMRGVPPMAFMPGAQGIGVTGNRRWLPGANIVGRQTF
jgi:PPE-repeat protein